MANKKKRKKKNKNNFNTKIIIAVVLCFIAIVMLIFTIGHINGKVVCSGVHEYDVGVRQLNDISFIYKNKNLNSIKVIKTITVNNEFKENQASYLDVINDSLKQVYKQKNINYVSKIEKNKLIITLTYNDKEKFILNDSDIIITTEGVSVNVMQEDNNNGRINIDMSKDYSKDNLKSIMANNKYSCN